MPRITRESLLTLEGYARTRKEFRARVLDHKQPRTIHLGEHVTLLFEDELTIRYQIQEMLRIEKTFEEAGIEEELDAYNPLVPDGSNLKATMLIEYEDVEERSVVGRNKSGHVDQHCWRGRLACQETYFYRCIFCVTHSAPAMLASGGLRLMG